MRTHGGRFLLASVVLIGIAACGSGAESDADASGAATSSAASDASSASGTNEPTEAESSSGPPSATACTAADILANAGEFTKAIDEYLRVQASTPEDPCIAAGMTKALADMKTAEAAAVSVDTCKVVTTFRDQKARADARRVLTAYIEKGLSCPDVTLDDLKDPRTFLGWLKLIGSILVGALVVLLVLATIAALIFRAFKPLRRVRRKLLPPEVIITGFESEDGAPDISYADLAGMLDRSTDEGERNDAFHIVDAYQDLVTGVGDIEKVHPSLGAAGALIGILGKSLGREKWALGGTVSIAVGGGTRRLFCASTFKVSGQEEESITYSVPLLGGATDAPTAEEKAAVIACVAGWVQRLTARLAEADLTEIPTAKAYGWLRGGIEAHEKSRIEVAEDCYARAADQDSASGAYTRARIAQALAEAEKAPDDENGLELAVNVLTTATELTANPDPKEADTMADALRLTYALAAARTHQAVKGIGASTRAPTAGERGLLEQASAAAVAAAAEGRAWAHEGAGKGSETARKFVKHTLAPACDILHSGAQVVLLSPPTEANRADLLAVAAATAGIISPPDLSYRVRYNLACFWSTWLSRCADLELPQGPTAAERGLHELTLALASVPQEREQRLAKWAATGDPSLETLRTQPGTGFADLIAQHTRP